MTFAILFTLLAQILDPQAPVHGYTTADPNNVDRLGLATPDGRFAITPTLNCDWIAASQNVLVWPDYQLPPWLAVAGIDGVLPGCTVRVEGRMSTVPCLANDAGECDVAAELEV